MTDTSPAMVRRIIEHLRSDGESVGIWSSLVFLEANDIDPILLSRALHAYLTESKYSPLRGAGSMTMVEERELVLALREAARDEAGRPGLTPEQRIGWDYSIEPFRSGRRSDELAKSVPEIRRMDVRYRKALLDEMVISEPDLVRLLGIAGRDRARDPMQWMVIDWRWLDTELRHAIATIRTELDYLEIMVLVRDLYADMATDRFASRSICE